MLLLARQSGRWRGLPIPELGCRSVIQDLSTIDRSIMNSPALPCVSLNAPPTDRPEKPSRAAEAATWLVRFKSPSFGLDSPYPNAAARNAAFVDWLMRSPA